MSEKSSSSGGGVGVIGLLGVAFVVLKLCGVINWPWWYVTLPFWGGLVLVVGVAIIIFGGAALIAGIGLAGGTMIDKIRELRGKPVRFTTSRPLGLNQSPVDEMIREQEAKDVTPNRRKGL